MVLGLRLFLEKNTKELHFGLLNILLLVLKNSFNYCFCKYCQGRKWRTGRRTYCSLCRLAYDSYEFEKRCDYAQVDFDGLCQIAKDILPYLEEYFEVGDHNRILDLFDDEYTSYIRDRHGKLTTTLRQKIESTTKLKKLNSQENYCFYMNDFLIF